MNPPIRRLAIVAAIMFCSLLVSSTSIMFFQAKALGDRSDNRRSVLASYDRERGQILVGGTPIAKSVATDDELRWERTYPSGRLYSHVTGYYSFTYGAGGGIEGAEDELLSGSSDKLFYRRISDLVSGRQPAGASVELTIRPEVQQAAEKALGDQRGAVVALDPRTGAILAMVSHPTYDPAELSSHRFSAVTDAWKSLNADRSKPLVNRAIGGDLYPPGSVFKLVTTAAALTSGQYDGKARIPAPAQLKLPLSSVPLTNWQNGLCTGSDQITLQQALETSCNSAFGGIGIKLGGDALVEQASKFGFGDELRVPQRVTPSKVPAGMDKAQSAQAAIGQYDVRVTPLQVAMVSAAIANKGVVMKPHLIASVRGDNLSVLDETKPEQLSKAVSSEVADQIAQMMRGVVEDGTGSNARISGVEVGGKTGTAQQGNDKAPHAWFTSIAPLNAAADQPQVAVAVVVEDGGSAGRETGGNKVAAPIAKQVMEAVIRK
ncbi:peptidoglycan D,D-transpeptidase FtsI family protein [Arsenicicoccus bolidensis]|uniref:peptidoglycan D,D-transpeptidase FtsI family protein n=1 Tax=Arsenicicoccus bolidensis TaxID=229480 RepID=UPI0028AEC787|nr:penicillin-binding transpeptidase domain-containing protein [Arsenicicoccus bolidensis]